MHCEDIVEQGATWRDSWRALEKAYAEGLVMSIGVSNFGLELLEEIWDFATVHPHLLQNFADAANLDLPVRKFCYEHEVLYMPYAMQRNYNHLGADVKNIISRFADAHDKSPHEVISMMFLQSRAAVIPRSDNPNHIVDNIRNVIGWRLSDSEMNAFGWGEISDEWTQGEL